MNRVNAILHHPLFVSRLERLEQLEANRSFCRHGLDHLLDVARLMWIASLEEGLGLDREVVYAAALLHDIGRGDQLERGVPHEEAGAALAAELLPQAGFSEEEAQEIRSAIQFHRGSGGARERSPLGALLYRADKQCRPCWRCKARKACNWPEERKNTGITR